MKASASASILVGVFLLLLSPTTTSGQDFPGCTLPFDSIKESHSLDSTCGPEGKTADASNQAQNRAKNNFCATDDPFGVTFNMFLSLQQAVESQNIPFGSGMNLPPDRSLLQNLVMVGGTKIGEGTLVRLVAFIVDAHYSNVSSGETVNCKLRGKENNDIHIMLGHSTLAAACDTVTAEMSPHFRPVAWDQLPDLNLRVPVRISGQLFLDASHRPCKNGTGPNPQRESIWEIHPLYAIDVCSSATLAKCSATNDSVWTPLDQWLSSDNNANLHQSGIESPKARARRQR
jgi:hypothetical protein